MNEDVKAKWVAALRSGEFEQCKEALRVGDKFCCLGVLSELAVRDGVIEPGEALQETDWRASRGNGETVYIYGGETGHLSDAVAEWAGLMSLDDWDEANPETFPDGDPSAEGRPLSAWNDSGSTFSEIADMIEKGL